MRIVYAEEFRKQFSKLPREIQRLYRTQENRFRKNWRDRRLQIKKLTGHQHQTESERPLPPKIIPARSASVDFHLIVS